MIPRVCIAILSLLLCAGPVSGEACALPTPPEQPEAGPGGRDYLFEGVRVTQHGRGADGYWLFEPSEPGDAALPVVVFVHGFNQISYGAYDLWLRHLVRKGSIVIYPKYQAGVWLDPATFTESSAKAIRDALKRCDGKRHAKADATRLAMVGHSLGGTIIANLAARAEHYEIPRPGALMLLQPGDVRTRTGLGAFFPSIVDDYSMIPEGTLMLIVAVEDDTVVGKDLSEKIYLQTRAVPKEDKDLLILDDDSHGRPALFANHFLPVAYTDTRGNRRADAYDYALWRWFDALTDAAHYDGRNRRLTLGGTDEQRDMGRWSDGRPIRKPEVYKPEGER